MSSTVTNAAVGNHGTAVGSKSSTYRPFDPPRGFGWGFNADKGTLTFFAPTRIRTYKADPPACWFKGEDHPRWRGSFGGEDFQIADLNHATRHLDPLRVRFDPKIRRRMSGSGLASMRRFRERLDVDAMELSSGLASDSWRLYCLLVCAPAVRSIAGDNPGLAMLMAHHRVQRGWRFRRMNRLAHRKRAEIASACGLPAEKQWVKLLARFPGQALSFRNMQRLSNIAATAPELIERLRHLPHITGGVLAVMNPDWSPHIHMSLLHEIANDPLLSLNFGHWRCGSERLLFDTITMLRALDERVPLFRTLRQLQNVHDAASERHLARQPDRTGPFGPPPLPETVAMVGLRSPGELRAEAKEQHNCLAAGYWADYCYDGRLYCYRINTPERASVAIQRGADGRWQIYEFKTRFNQEPGAATVRAVRKWLRDGAQALAQGWQPGDGRELNEVAEGGGAEESAIVQRGDLYARQQAGWGAFV